MGGSNGSDIYLYDHGLIKKITNNPSGWNQSAQINDPGQIVWRGSDGNDYEIYLYDHGVIKQITNNTAHEYGPQINAGGQIVWSESDKIYYYSGNDDYYTGKVYRNPTSTVYYPGLKLTKTNELGLDGYYQITGVSYSGVDKSNYGQVFVTKYYDGDNTKKSFTPVDSTNPKGTTYLKSELGFIKNADVSIYRFGRGYYEADAGDTYSFRYTYSLTDTNCDWYKGKVYRDPASTVYYPGWKKEKKNETGQTGYWEILRLSYTGETAKYGKVYVSRYHDGDRPDPKNFTPVAAANPMGTGLLGCELGYIPAAGIPAHRFGKGYYEADE